MVKNSVTEMKSQKKLIQSWGEDAHNKQHKVDKMKLNCRIVKSYA